ncbi:hypothetical protein PAPHI01_1753 [Pancytospora philotis]|nr:hypothetical protein PAPHI01_1753 [Pancytospora philotis]
MLLGFCHALAMLVQARPGDDVDMETAYTSLQRGAVQENSTTKEFFTLDEVELLERICARHCMHQDDEMTERTALGFAKKWGSRRCAVIIIGIAYQQNSLEESMKYLVSLAAALNINDRPAAVNILRKLFTRACIEFARVDPHYRHKVGDKGKYANLFEADLDSGRVCDIHQELGRPIDELLDRYWTPLPPILSASSDL